MNSLSERPFVWRIIVEIEKIRSCGMAFSTLPQNLSHQDRFGETNHKAETQHQRRFAFSINERYFLEPNHRNVRISNKPQHQVKAGECTCDVFVCVCVILVGASIGWVGAVQKIRISTSSTVTAHRRRTDHFQQKLFRWDCLLKRCCSLQMSLNTGGYRLNGFRHIALECVGLSVYAIIC